jgi:hypothetical protein
VLENPTSHPVFPAQCHCRRNQTLIHTGREEVVTQPGHTAPSDKSFIFNFETLELLLLKFPPFPCLLSFAAAYSPTATSEDWFDHH